MYSLDFRKKVFKIKEKENLTFEETSKRFHIGIVTLFRWQQRIEPIIKRNVSSRKIDMEVLKIEIEKNPDLYQWELAEKFNVTAWGIDKALKRLGKTYKKTYFHPKANEVLRKDFQEKIEKYQKQSKVIVYIDESGFAQDMPRVYGYSDKGIRCYDKKDWNSRRRINAIGAIIKNKLLTLSLFNTNIDSDIFYTWLEKDLIPKLPKDSVIVMDNATFHKRKDMQEIIQNNNHTLIYLPPYSPDLNPIEHKWSQAKSIRRKERCSVNELFENHMEYVKF